MVLNERLRLARETRGAIVPIEGLWHYWYAWRPVLAEVASSPTRRRPRWLVWVERRFVYGAPPHPDSPGLQDLPPQYRSRTQDQSLRPPERMIRPEAQEAARRWRNDHFPQFGLAGSYGDSYGYALEQSVAQAIDDAIEAAGAARRRSRRSVHASNWGDRPRDPRRGDGEIDGK